ncbi:hypothetical protein [Bradyrhizobium sp. CCBAU 11434]|uniref:hypothetical protein n=1 Tax=Bradyrhizobium sp. CCBAU 11434 TaxID=1630885 RepID=UPI002306C4CB|nr:hypothetical protein [Bradyrhizobium sp. CCBAU 11434]
MNNRPNIVRPNTRFFVKNGVLAGLSLQDLAAIGELPEPVGLKERMALHESKRFLDHVYFNEPHLKDRRGREHFADRRYRISGRGRRFAVIQSSSADLPVCFAHSGQRAQDPGRGLCVESSTSAPMSENIFRGMFRSSHCTALSQACAAFVMVVKNDSRPGSAWRVMPSTLWCFRLRTIISRLFWDCRVLA